MKSKYIIAKSISWQSYDCLDLLIILNRKNLEFYFFQSTGKYIVSMILQEMCVEQICDICMGQYEVTYDVIAKSVGQFLLLLQQEGIIYDYKEGI